jgi:hypothetical protein
MKPTSLTNAMIRLRTASKPVCCPNAPARKIPRDLNEDSRDVACALAKTPGYERSRHRLTRLDGRFRPP